MIRAVVCLVLLQAFASGWVLNGVSSRSRMMARVHRFSMLSDAAEPVVSETPAATEAAPGKKSKDLSKFTVGEKIEGTVSSAKQFGIFVKLGNGVDALLPRSTLSRSSYDKLKNLADKKSAEKVSVEIASINLQNQTISAKYLPTITGDAIDLTTMDAKELKSRVFNATVLSKHDFGVFAKIDGSDIDGLIPASLLPEKPSSYTTGSKVVVKVNEYNTETKKLTLTMKFSSQDVSTMLNFPHDRYIQGVVQKVFNYGVIVRSVGYDVSGLLHMSQIPRNLVTALKKRIDVDASANKTDIELVFQEGDVIKMRVNSVNVDANKIEFSMQQYRASDDEEDDYIVEGRETEEEMEEAEREARDNDDDYQYFDPEDLILWWRGAPYVKEAVDTTAAVDEDLEVIMESTKVVEGTWRRLFEIDLREDEADFSAKAFELEEKELAEEIGELAGLDEELVVDPIGFGGSKNTLKLAGSFVSLASLPEEWKSQLAFLKEQEAEESIKQKGLRAGKKGEQTEFSALVSKIEAEAQNAAAARAARRTQEVSAGADAGASDAPAAE